MEGWFAQIRTFSPVSSPFLQLAIVPPRFRTNSALPGTERLAVCKPDCEFLDDPYDCLPLLDGAALECLFLFAKTLMTRLTVVARN